MIQRSSSSALLNMQSRIRNLLRIAVSCSLVLPVITACSLEKKTASSDARYVDNCQEAVRKELRSELYRPANMAFEPPERIEITTGEVRIAGQATLLNKGQNRQLKYLCTVDTATNLIAHVGVEWLPQAPSTEQAGTRLCHSAIEEKSRLKGVSRIRFSSTHSQPLSRWLRHIQGTAKAFKQDQWHPITYRCRVDIRSGSIAHSDYQLNNQAPPVTTVDRSSESCREAVAKRVIEIAQEQDQSIILTNIESVATGQTSQGLNRIEGSFRILGEAADLRHGFSCAVATGSGQIKDIQIDYP